MKDDKPVTRGVFGSLPSARNWAALLALAFIVVAALRITPAHEWGDDWAQYVNHARSLAEHRPYSDTGYLFNPARPNIGPPNYPPGTAMLLAPVEAAFGLDLRALKMVSVLTLGFGLFAGWLALSRFANGWLALLAMVFFGLHPSVTSLVNVIASEPPFLLFSFLALALAGAQDRLGAPPSAAAAARRRGLASALLTGVCVYLAIACRSIGVALIAALVVHEALGARLRRAFLWVVLALALGGVWLQGRLLANADYSNELVLFSVQRVLDNLTGYWGSLGFLFLLPGKLQLLTPLPVLVLVVMGLVSIVNARRAAMVDPGRAPARAPAPAWLTWLRAVPLAAWYFGAYVAALILLPFEQNARYLLPVLPLILLFALQGARVVLARVRPGALLPRVALAAFALFYGALWWHALQVPRGENVMCGDCRALFDAVQDRVPEGERLAFAKPRALALLTRRPVFVWARDRGADQTWAELDGEHVGWLVTVRPDHELARLYPDALSWEGWRSHPGATLVYENPSFRLVRLAHPGPSGEP